MASRVEELVPFAANDAAPPTREWFTAAELAELALPGLPADKRSINRKAQTDGWSMRRGADGAALVRPREGRGGGVEFHVSVLPSAARLELARRGITRAQPIVQEVETDRGGWRWFDAQSGKIKSEAERRLVIVREILLLEESTGNRTAAIAECAGEHDVSTSTLWGWLRLVEGVAPADRLPALAPRRKGGGKEAEIDFLLWAAFKSDYLAPECPTLSSCYDRTAQIARERGLSLPSQAAFRRRLKREVPPAVIRLAREGEEALRQSIPSQNRSVEGLRALECVNIDGHVWDVFVIPPDGGKPVRPLMVAIQDVYSRKMLAWRLALSENAVTTRLAFADLFENFGIPRDVVMDNGRGFNSKWLTGRMKTRFRFTIKPDEPMGLLTGLGITIHPTLPYRGQSKPIERAFRDLCDRVAKAPACRGAYTGNKPTAKPENYGSKAIPWAEFEKIVANGIFEHNAKLGRRAGVCRGRSFDETFAESYAKDGIGKVATPEQLRKALMAAERVTVDRRTGHLELYGNRYWSPACDALHGQRVTVRFDPDNLHRDVHLYDSDDGFLASVPLFAASRFFDAAAAKAAAKRWSDYKKRIRAGLEAERLLSAEELAAMLPNHEAPELPEARVIRPVRHRGSAAPAVRPQTQPAAPAIDRMRAAVLRLVEPKE